MPRYKSVGGEWVLDTPEPDPKALAKAAAVAKVTPEAAPATTAEVSSSPGRKKKGKKS